MVLSLDDITKMERFFLTEKRLSEVLKEQRQEYAEDLNLNLAPLRSDICEIKESLKKGNCRFVAHERELAQIKRTCEDKHRGSNGSTSYPAYIPSMKPGILSNPALKYGIPTGGGAVILGLIYLLLHLLGVQVPMP
jgi:hypothetical protein